VNVTTALSGDANLDGTVNFADLVIVAQNYGQSGRTLSQGNLDYSAGGAVDFNDLVILAQHYGSALSPLSVLATSGSASESKSGFTPDDKRKRGHAITI